MQQVSMLLHAGGSGRRDSNNMYTVYDGQLTTLTFM